MQQSRQTFATKATLSSVESSPTPPPVSYHIISLFQGLRHFGGSTLYTESLLSIDNLNQHQIKFEFEC